MIADDVRERIRARRESLNLSQNKLAKLLGWSQTVYWNLETGARKISLDDLEQIARALQTTIPELLGYENMISDVNTPADNAAIRRIEQKLDKQSELFALIFGKLGENGLLGEGGGDQIQDGEENED